MNRPLVDVIQMITALPSSVGVQAPLLAGLAHKLACGDGLTFAYLQENGWGDMELLQSSTIMNDLIKSGHVVRKYALLEIFGDKVGVHGEFDSYAEMKVPDGAIQLLIVSVFYLVEVTITVPERREVIH